MRIKTGLPCANGLSQKLERSLNTQSASSWSNVFLGASSWSNVFLGTRFNARKNITDPSNNGHALLIEFSSFTQINMNYLKFDHCMLLSVENRKVPQSYFQYCFPICMPLKFKSFYTSPFPDYCT